LRQFDAVHAMIRGNPGTIAWARTAADVRANAKRGRISAVFGVEGGHALLPGNEAEMLAAASASVTMTPAEQMTTVKTVILVKERRG
jgi:microsomal dipeptidase-like Zn-dependent dipeptidase